LPNATLLTRSRRATAQRPSTAADTMVRQNSTVSTPVCRVASTAPMNPDDQHSTSTEPAAGLMYFEVMVST
jgi:hypothetical protein